MVAREKPGPPMMLANMRKNGVHAIIAICQVCGHEADVRGAYSVVAEEQSVPAAGYHKIFARYALSANVGWPSIDFNQWAAANDSGM
jgi:hypothetical protein